MIMLLVGTTCMEEFPCHVNVNINSDTSEWTTIYAAVPEAYGVDLLIMLYTTMGAYHAFLLQWYKHLS